MSEENSTKIASDSGWESILSGLAGPGAVGNGLAQSSSGERCENCGIRNTALFADLEEADFSLIHQPIDDLDYPVGEVLYAAGDKAMYLYTIRKGLLKLEQYLPDGTQRIVRLLNPGDVAGLETVLSGEYQHTAVALEPISVCRIPRGVIRNLNEHTPRLHGQLMERWQKALQEADKWLTELSTGTAKERVARLLLKQAGVADGAPFHLLGREDIGAMLGITTETASRVVAEFKRAKLISVSGGYAQVIDTESLSGIAGKP